MGVSENGVYPPNRGPQCSDTPIFFSLEPIYRTRRSSPAQPPLGTAVGPPSTRTKNRFPVLRGPPPGVQYSAWLCSENIWSKDSAKIGSENYQDFDFDVVFLLVRIWELTQPATIVNEDVLLDAFSTVLDIGKSTDTQKGS